MNYIELINNFWQMRRTTPLLPVEADLYYFLLQESNIRGWQNSFECSNKLVCALLSISEKTLISARRRLQRKGFIRFKAGNRRHKSPTYYIAACPTQKAQYAKSAPEACTTKSEGKSSPKAKSKVFVKPAVDEVAIYCAERMNGIDPQAFIDFYESKNWMVGCNKMSDWRAALRTWERRRPSPPGNKQHASVTHRKGHDYEQF